MDDQQLVSVIGRCQKGDRAAFEWIVNAFGGSIFAFLLRMVGRRDLAEDLLQDVFVRMIGSIGRYDHRDRFAAWLFRIAANLVRDHVRKIRRRGQTFSGDSTDGDHEATLSVLPAEEPAAAERLAADEDRRRLHWALGQLSEEYRQVVLLRHYSQLSFKEIAEILGCPLGTALARMHRGLARLRALMGAPQRPKTNGPQEREPQKTKP
jgi:RNA polymerase sigma-70 factor (ECF subfamily)